MANAIQPNLGKVYLLKNGEVKDPLGLNNFNAVSNINMLLVHIEDGDSTNFVTINYLPNKMTNWTSNDFPLFFKGMVDHTLTGEAHPRRFAQYVTYVPPQIASMNINGQSPMNVGVTVKQTAGTRLLGAFTDLQSLINQHTPNETLRDENYVAYVMATEEIGYYMVEYNVVTSTYEWKLNTSGTYAGEVFIRGYNMFNITIQRSGNNPKPNGNISDLQLNMIWQQLNILGGQISFLEDNLIQFINIVGTDTIYESIANIQNNIADITINVRVAEPAFGENLIEITGDGLLVDETKVINLVGSILDVSDTQTLELIKEVDIDGNIDIRGNVIIDSSVDNLLESNANGLLVDKNNVEAFVEDRMVTPTTPLNDAILEVVQSQINPIVDAEQENNKDVVLKKQDGQEVTLYFGFEDIDDELARLETAKLDKNFQNLANQTLTNLTDSLVINRGGVAYKTTLADLLSHVVVTELFVIVNELPEEGQANKIYLLVKPNDGDTTNIYEEYIWINNDWELIGSVSIDLSNYYTKAQIDTLLGGKVDKVAGKGLSTNDYTTTEKNKLAGISAGAQVNVLEGVQVNGVDRPIVAKKVNIEIGEFPAPIDIVIQPSDFTSLVANKTVSGLGLGNPYIVVPSENFTTAALVRANGEEYANAELVIQNTANNVITFTASNLPTTDIKVTVYIMTSSLPVSPSFKSLIVGVTKTTHVVANPNGVYLVTIVGEANDGHQTKQYILSSQRNVITDVLSDISTNNMKYTITFNGTSIAFTNFLANGMTLINMYINELRV